MSDEEKKPKRRYTVYGALSVGVVTSVMAESPEQAREIAECRDVQSLCHQCAGSDDVKVEWGLCDSLNGDIEISDDPGNVEPDDDE